MSIIPATMRALQQTSLEGPESLRLVNDAPVPSPGQGQVLIRVIAAGVNFLDISQSRGMSAGGPQPPYLAGIEGAGEVVALGHGASGVKVGAHVIGVGIGGGAFAEYMVLPAAGAVPVPAGWADEQALGMVVSWPTALAALKPLGLVEAGQTVLIHAAAGGTGQAAVKMAKHYGARVIAVASPEKHQVVWALGADHVLDSRGSDIAAEVLQPTGGAGVDLVLESVGGDTLETSMAAARRVTGRVVVYGLAGGEAALTNWDLVYKHQIHLIGLNIGILIQSAPQIFGEVMGEMFRLIAAGVLSPGQPALYELAEGPKALAKLEREPPSASSPSCRPQSRFRPRTQLQYDRDRPRQDRIGDRSQPRYRQSPGRRSLARGAKHVYAGTRQLLTHTDRRVTPLMLDVTNAAQIQAAADQVEALDILINNAGIMLPDHPFDPAVLERHLTVNLFGSNTVTQAFLPALISSRGAVVNMLSCVALAPLPTFTSYSISKSAAFSLTKTLRAAHAEQGVTFHAVLAGPIDTDMTRQLEIPKTSPTSAARAIFDAFENGEEDIFPDPATAPLAPAWAAGVAKLLEHQFALLRRLKQSIAAKPQRPLSNSTGHVRRISSCGATACTRPFLDSGRGRNQQRLRPAICHLKQPANDSSKPRRAAYAVTPNAVPQAATI